MELTLEEKTFIYIKSSIKNIDFCIAKREWKKAFGLFISVVGNLRGKDQLAFIDYYSDNMESMGFFDPCFPFSIITCK